MKQYRIVPFLLAILLSLSACGGGENPASSGGEASSAVQQEAPPAERTLPFTLAAYPAYSFHPALAANRANLTLAPLMYEGLFQVDASFQAVPVLCRGFLASEDKLTWTFTLRTGITFSDGTPLTAREAADALNLARSPQGRYAQRLADVVSVVGEEQVLTITLRRPNGSLPLLLDIPIALGGGDRPAGTGPYVLAGTEEEPVLSARPGWWQGKSLPLATIPLRAVSKSDELIYAFDAGEVSLVDVDLMATNAMGYAGNYQTWDYATTDFLYLGFNAQTGPCRDPEIRQTLALAVSQITIKSTVYANHAVSTWLPVHPDSPLYSPRVLNGTPGYDPEGLAAQARDRRLAGKTLVFLVNSENTAKASAAQLIAYQLEAAGYAVELRQLPFDEYTATLSAREFDLYLAETVLTADFDLAPLLSSTGSLNYGGWWAETADSLLWAMQSAAPEEKIAAAENLFTLLNEQVPIVPILFKNGSVLTRWGRMSGLSPVRNNVFYQLENWIVS